MNKPFTEYMTDFEVAVSSLKDTMSAAYKDGFRDGYKEGNYRMACRFRKKLIELLDVSAILEQPVGLTLEDIETVFDDLTKEFEE